MTHFEGWEDTWASFDDYTVAAFKAKTGLDAKKDFKLGDFSDPNFRQWVTFRIETFTEFLREINRTAKSVNPNIKTIPEIYPGIEQDSCRRQDDVRPPRHPAFPAQSIPLKPCHDRNARPSRRPGHGRF